METRGVDLESIRKRAEAATKTSWAMASGPSPLRAILDSQADIPALLEAVERVTGLLALLILVDDFKNARVPTSEFWKRMKEAGRDYDDDLGPQEWVVAKAKEELGRTR